MHLGLASMCLLQWGTPEQQQHWLPQLARGERIATFGLTEPGAGSDVAALRMRARAVNGGFVLSGEKTWISAANQASLFVLFATVDPALRHRGITAFIVPRDSPGLSTSVLHGKLGVRAGILAVSFATTCLSHTIGYLATWGGLSGRAFRAG